MTTAVIGICMIMSVITFAAFGIDKYKAVHHKWRIPEATLILLSLFGGAVGGLLGMLIFHHKTRKWKFRIWVPLFALIQILLCAFFLWASDYYHAGETAQAALISDDAVSVTKTRDRLFGGPADDTALIFYPGAKVEETAYAPLLRELAENGIDVYLVKMPLHLAVFGMNRASGILNKTAYESYYIGGHSLGGAMAASYAAEHGDALDGVILLAAYPTKELDHDLCEILIYGSEDGVLNMDRVAEGDLYAPDIFCKYVIEGGNHALFGDYGEQTGDGEAAISAQAQWEETVRVILEAKP